jgi:hypothetical protein
MAFTIAYSNFKKGLKMAFGPLGIKYLTQGCVIRTTREQYKIPIRFFYGKLNELQWDPERLKSRVVKRTDKDEWTDGRGQWLLGCS